MARKRSTSKLKGSNNKRTGSVWIAKILSFVLRRLGTDATRTVTTSFCRSAVVDIPGNQHASVLVPMHTDSAARHPPHQRRSCRMCCQRPFDHHRRHHWCSTRAASPQHRLRHRQHKLHSAGCVRRACVLPMSTDSQVQKHTACCLFYLFRRFV